MRRTIWTLNASLAALAWSLTTGLPTSSLAEPAGPSQAIHFKAHLEQPIAGQDSFEQKVVECDWARAKQQSSFAICGTSIGAKAPRGAAAN